MEIVLKKLYELSNDIPDAIWVEDHLKVELKLEIDLLILRIKLEGINSEVKTKLEELYNRGNKNRRLERLQSYIGEIQDYLGKDYD